MEQTTPVAPVRPLPWKWGVYLTIGLVLLAWLLNTPAGLLGKADAVGYAVCHRLDARSFHLGDRQLPLCARCTGTFMGAALGLVYQSAVGRRRAGMPPWKLWIPLGLFAAAFFVDGVNSFMHLIPAANLPSLYEPQNWLRLLTGTGMGLAIAAALFPVFNQTAWAEWDKRPALNGWRALGGLLALAAALDLLVLTENPLILYPLALISVAGVAALLTMIYTMLWLMITRLENRIHTLSELAFPLALGFVTALIQTALLDAARFWLTGTWSGFRFG